MGVLVTLGVGLGLGRAVAEGDGVCAGAVADAGDDACGVGAVVDSVALHATRIKAAGSTLSAFTQPVFMRSCKIRPGLRGRNLHAVFPQAKGGLTP